MLKYVIHCKKSEIQSGGWPEMAVIINQMKKTFNNSKLHEYLLLSLTPNLPELLLKSIDINL